jgi:hypothetical protein
MSPAKKVMVLGGMGARLAAVIFVLSWAHRPSVVTAF